MNKYQIKKILVIIVCVALFFGCSSSIYGRQIYHSTDHEIEYEISEQYLILKSANNREMILKILKIDGRIVEVDNAGESLFVSIFDENCFKPRRLRSIILSKDINVLSPYNRSTHCNESYSIESDKILNELLNLKL